MTTPGAVVAILPARGGSKRIPRKNVRPFLGVPILSRTIGLLSASGLFDQIVVSTDDEEIAALARAAGADVPFRRPRSLADDHTGTEAVVRHAIEAIEERTESRLRLVCAVYPTAVLLRSEDLADAKSMILATDADFVFSATTYGYPIQRALRLRADGFCEMIAPENLMTRSQDLEPAYHDAGQFYWGWRDAWMAKRPLFMSRTRMYLIPRYRVQDIDTPEDWERAEIMYRLFMESSK